MTSTLQSKLASGRFVLTAEVCPPKGSDCADFLEKSRKLSGLVDAINVTDNQGATMRISPLAAAALLVREGIEPIFQITCRDRNRLALQSDLLGAAALGIENVLALTGDHISFGDHCAGKPVFDLDSVQLLQAIKGLGAGQDLAGKSVTGAPAFFVGAAAAPEAEPFPLTFYKLEKKVAAGAQFFQTQAIFDPERLRLFSEAVRPLKVKVIAGILLLKSAGMARFVTNNIPGLKVPAPLIEELEAAADPLAAGVAIAGRLAAACKPYCDGLHFMAMGREDLIPEILKAVGGRWSAVGS
ncbi:methylenetetrahydrofolate reductase [Geotalea uraniireducens]|uniref:Methylenetetrahydrofolate reductase n=1 Tax=Geotalea uraniireducens (strain Rf4) TaxID=351605 RepID=A5GAM7_GEOUR|nr:methylenetetrahydrofolate reductase [Geotalea uraniireducens]ABQ25375.1 methylenetetrahydrofolate reductase [Geotalea uraniireducens Rf4]